MKPLTVKPSVPSSGAALALAEAPPTLTEIFARTATDGAATGFALAHLRPGGSVLWVQDRPSRREGGRPCLAGLGMALDLLHLQASRPRDALWAIEQGLGCPALSAVVGEVWGDPAVLDFTATRRLALRAEAQGVRALLIRRAAAPDLSAARERWWVGSAPSGVESDDGPSRWRITLFRSRRHLPAEWVVRHEKATNRLVPTQPPGQASGQAPGRAPEHASRQAPPREVRA